MNGEIIKGAELSYAINKRNCDASLTDEEKVLRHELMHLVSDLILLAETHGEDVLRASTATMLVEGQEGLLQINLLGEKGWVGSATSALAPACNEHSVKRVIAAQSVEALLQDPELSEADKQIYNEHKPHYMEVCRHGLTAYYYLESLSRSFLTDVQTLFSGSGDEVSLAAFYNQKRMSDASAKAIKFVDKQIKSHTPEHKFSRQMNQHHLNYVISKGASYHG